MDTIIKYMINREWVDDVNRGRKFQLWKLAWQSKKSSDISTKIGGMLIYNQVIDQTLRDIVEYSINFIKAEIWPTSVQMNINFERATFGKVIDGFEQYAVIHHNRDIILKLLRAYNRKRNDVVHKLFHISDLEQLKAELDEYAVLADEILELLLEYDNAICDDFCRLDERKDFTVFAEA